MLSGCPVYSPAHIFKPVSGCFELSASGLFTRAGSGSLARDRVDLHDFWHARHLSNLPRPYTNLIREVVSQIIGTGGQTEYDRLVVALSGGALGISFAFVERFVGDDPPLALWTLMAAWVAWVCSLTLMLGSHFVSTKALRKAVIQVDKYLRKTVATVDEEKTDTERVWSNNYDRVVGSLNAFGGLTFILGTLFASAFFLCNLE